VRHDRRDTQETIEGKKSGGKNKKEKKSQIRKYMKTKKKEVVKKYN
jgi:hypothetical protein